MNTICESHVADLGKCNRCGALGDLHLTRERDIKDLHNIIRRIKYGIYKCRVCDKYFSYVDSHSYIRQKRYTKELIDRCVKLKKSGMTYLAISKKVELEHGHRIPVSTLADFWADSLWTD